MPDNIIDDNLIYQAIHGDIDAFGEIVEKISPALGAIAYAQCGNEEEARDLVQETIVESYQKLSELKEPKAFRAWIFQIVRNKAISFVRSKRAERSAKANWLDKIFKNQKAEINKPEESAIKREEKDNLLEAVSKLDENDREIILLRYYSHMTCNEAALALDISEDAANKRLQRAVKRLKDIL
jgi:RNA polymerase sigma-70 factor (ECF subfamily)